MLLVAVVGIVAAGLGIGVPALNGAHVAVDEEQYYLSAISLAEDGNLDITDEIAEQRWRAFADVAPQPETSIRPDGSQLSPHDPLLPVLLAGPAALGGWVAAKAALAALAGVLAALTLWLAVRRFGVALRLATVGVAVASASAPLAVYGQQLYPELPAALAVVLAVAALSGPVRGRELVLLAVTVTALPWLSVKYALVAAVLAVLGAWRWWRAGERGAVAGFTAGLAAMGGLYLLVHRAVWGGWTVYASGDHFAYNGGEFTVIGVDPDYVHRAWRLVGLLLDRDYGLVPWQPAWLLVVPAVAALVAARRAGTLVLVAPLAAGWVVATFVALTMAGYWFPGRQVVVVMPLALLCVLCWLDGCSRRVQWLALGLGAAGVVNYAVLLVQGWLGQTTWVVHFSESVAPFFRMVSPVLGDYRHEPDWRFLAALALVLGLVVYGWRTGRRGRLPQPPREDPVAAR